MKRPSKSRTLQSRALVFGALPCAIGLGGAQGARWADAVWLTDAGAFWPYSLAAISLCILIKLAVSPIKDATSAVAAWLTLLVTWFYVPMWAMATEVPATAAVVSRGGRVSVVRDASRHPGPSVSHLTDRPGTRIVNNVVGKLAIAGLELDYSYAPPYIATRQDRADLSDPLVRAATPLIEAVANGTRTSRIAFLESRAARDGLLSRICRSAFPDATDCPIEMKLATDKEAALPGGTWSSQFSETEAIAEKHLPSLIRLLTQADIQPEKRDKIFRLFLDLSGASPRLAEVALKSHNLADAQFDELIDRIVSSPGCGDVAVLVASVNRLTELQRRTLRSKAIDEARISLVAENAAVLRLSDAELARLGPRMRQALLADPSTAVRILDIFGDRLPIDTQRAAVDGIIAAKAHFALSALGRLNFSQELRNLLVQKVVADVALDDFTAARLSKERLQDALKPAEMRALITVAIKRGEVSDDWHNFAMETLPVPDMTPAERRALLNGLLFKSPKDALEFASRNRDFLDPAEVADVTRDYTRTITRDFCLHLSHRNKNRRTQYFSEAQLQIFRGCAESN